MLCKQGFSDLKLKLGENELKCVKSLLCSQNALFSQLLNDAMNENDELILSSKCSVESIQLLLIYYGFGEIEISKENVIDLLKTCIYYNELNVINYCCKYISSHFDLEILIDLLNCSEILRAECCDKIQELVSERLDEMTIDLLSDKTISKLSYNSLIYVLSKEKIKLESESKLFNNLCIWLKNEKNANKKVNEDDENNEIGFEEKRNELLNKINWKEINMSGIKEENIEFIPKISYNELIEESKSIHHNYMYEFNELDDEEDANSPNFITRSIHYSLETNDVDKLMKLCSVLPYYNLNLIDEKILKEYIKRLLDIYSELSKENKRNVSKLFACCSNIISPSSFLFDFHLYPSEALIKKLSEPFIFISLYYSYIKDVTLAQSYVFELLTLLRNPENYKYYDDKDYDILEKENIFLHDDSLKENKSYKFNVGQNVDIDIPKTDFASCFKCELPDGLSIDYYSGKITGMAKKETKGKYTVYYRDPSKTSIEIELIINASSSLFGNIQTTYTSSNNPTAFPSSLFGNNQPSSTLSLFGNFKTRTSSASSLLGNNQPTTSSASSLLGNNQPTTSSTPSLFRNFKTGTKKSL